MFLPEFSGVGIAGDRLAIVGSTIGELSPSRDAEVYVVDLTQKRLAATLRLSGIRAGQVREIGTPPEDIRNVVPGIAWDLPRGRLYVVDADDGRVAVVDVATGTLRGPVQVPPRSSLLDRFLALISSPAAAKAQAFTESRAVVSPDGRRLYVSGIRSDFPGGSAAQITPLGLQVIDTEDLTQLARIDTTSTELAISPDGRRLLAITNRYEPTGWTGYELRIIDAPDLTQKASVPLEGRGQSLAFAPSGDAVYVTAHIDLDSTVLRRLTLSDPRIQQIRKIDGYGVLIPSWN
jgi:DNA-binding beta-propeller fold protein YncE